MSLNKVSRSKFLNSQFLHSKKAIRLSESYNKIKEFRIPDFWDQADLKISTERLPAGIFLIFGYLLWITSLIALTGLIQPIFLLGQFT